MFSEKLADPFQAKACLGGCLGDSFSRPISARLVKENKIFTLRMHFVVRQLLQSVQVRLQKVRMFGAPSTRVNVRQ